MLRRDLRVGLQIAEGETPESPTRLFVTGLPADVTDALDKLELLLIDPSPAELQLHQEESQTVDIFVDNSNLLIAARFLPDGTVDGLVRLHVARLSQTMGGARKIRRKVVVGSKPPRNHSIWKRWEDAGYEVLLNERDRETNREQGVDDRLVASASMHIDFNPPGILVLGTGDGNQAGQRPGTYAANFRNLVKKATDRGWTVEIWSWRLSCNRCYMDMAADTSRPGRVKVVLLDSLRSLVTFRAAAPVMVAGDPAAVAQDDDADLCIACLSEAVTHAFQPCSHRVLCRACTQIYQASRHTACAICRQPYTSISEIPV